MAATYFHWTTKQAAKAILRHGFKDTEGRYLTTTLHKGVWISDRPLDPNIGPKEYVLLTVKIDGRRVRVFEWIEEGKGYREFLVPARTLNKYGTIRPMSDEEAWVAMMEKSRGS